MTITATQFPVLPGRSTASGAPAGSVSEDEVPGSDVSWRALSASLWVARRDGRHLGTVQHGRRWLAADADSEPIGVFRTFSEAQAAVASPASRPAEARGSALAGPALVVAVSLLAALGSAGLWAWTNLLL
jgi:hypothetical protein